MRPLPIVIALLLAGAVLACSGRVPAPGATLSGSVWVDRNANGVRDKCDFGLVRGGLHVQLTGGNGRLLTARVDRNETFAFSKVSAGEYTLGIRQDRAFQWPVTAPTDTETPSSYALVLNGYEEADGFEFGVATDWPMSLYPDGYGLFAMLFNDEDGDGKVGAGECALRGNEGIGVSTRDMDWMPSGGELAVFQLEDLREPPSAVSPRYWPGWIDREQGLLVPTRLDREGCPQAVQASPIKGSRLYRAAIGMQRVEGMASVNAGVFADLDADGVRDEGEPDLQLPVLIRGHCEDGLSLAASGFEDGIYRFANVPAGRWEVQVDTAQPHARFAFEIVATSPEAVAMEIQEHDEIEVEFGVAYPGAGFIRVLLVRDDNGNGVADSGEPPVRNAAIFCEPSEGETRIEYCGGHTGTDGSAAVLGPIYPGQYKLWATVSEHSRGSLIRVSVEENQVASLTVAVAP